ncbi:MAG TPA: hypothetical protein VGD56_17615 [Gemmatirosa sp.]
MSSAILQQVVEATRGEYVVHGTVGRSDALGSAFLARDVASGRSVLLVVPPDAESLDVVAALSDTIPADAGGCAACGFRVGTWVDACPRCEHGLLPPPGASPDVDVVRDQLRETYDVIGSLPHVRGGTVYFGYDAGDRRLVAFVLRPQPDGQLAIDPLWEAVPDATTAPAASYGVVTAPGTATSGMATSGMATSGVAAPDVAPAYDDGGERLAAAVHDDAPPARRPWLPIGLGVGAIALVGAAAFAFTHHEAPPVVPTRAADSAAAPGSSPSLLGGPVVPPPQPRDSTPVTPIGGTSAPAVVPDSVLRAQHAWRRRRDSLRLARTGAVLTIDGDELPHGWSVSVNGGPALTARDVPIPNGGPAVIRIVAPGYCADTLAINPAPGSHQHWSPTLRGTPTVGEC